MSRSAKVAKVASVIGKIVILYNTKQNVKKNFYITLAILHLAFLENDINL